MSENIGFTARGPVATNAVRLFALRSAIRLEMKGLKMSRGRSALAIAKAEFGLSRGTKAEKVIEAIEAKLAEIQPEAAKNIETF
jgi:hypothetical protein